MLERGRGGSKDRIRDWDFGLWILRLRVLRLVQEGR
jgi:hypothetical protein